MPVSDWLGAIGGALEGVQGQQRHDETLQMQQDRLEIQRMQQEIRSQLEQLKEGGRNTRSDNTLATRKEVADADRKQRADAVVANTDLGYSRIASDEGLGYTRDATTRRGQDLGDEHYWDQAGRQWSDMLMDDTTRRRGQDVSSSTARRGQDLLHEDRGAALEAGGDSRAMSYALRAYEAELRRRKTGGNPFGGENDTPTFSDWLQTSDDPEIFPSVREMFSGGRTPPAAAPAAAVPPSTPAPGTRPAAPVPPRLRPQTSAKQPPPGLAVGKPVKLRTGQTVTVTKINPDGTFEYK